MIAIVVFFTLVTVSLAGPVCLSCNHVPIPQDCNRVVTCGDNEACYVERFLTPDGHLYYDTGCKDTVTCGTKVGRRSNVNKESTLNSLIKAKRVDLDTSICHGCCVTGNICNVDGMCGAPPLERRNGTICYSCDNIEKPEDCNFIKLCTSSQKCAVKQKSTALSQRVLYWSGCESQHICDVTTSEYCCKGEMCNNRFRCKLILPKAPQLSDPIVTRDGDVQFQCTFEYPAHNAERFKVTWTVDGTPLVDHHNRPVSQMLGSERIAVLDSYNLAGNMNKMLRCKVQPYCNDNPSDDDGLQSNGYWVGMKVLPTRLGFLKETIIRIESTLPIVCSDGVSQNCSPTITLDEGTDSTACSYTLQKESSGIFATNISVSLHPHSFLPVKDKLEFKPLNSIAYPAWNPYHFPTIQIDKFRSTPHLEKCQLQGDHIIKFNHPSQKDSNTGYIDMYKANQFQVQVKRVACGNSTCTCAIAIKEYTNGVQIDVCDQTQLVPIIKYLSQKRMTVSQSNDGKTIKVTTLTGQTVDLDIVDGPDIHVTVNKDPSVKSSHSGLCYTGWNVYTKETSLFDKVITNDPALALVYNHCYCMAKVVHCSTDF